MATYGYQNPGYQYDYSNPNNIPVYNYQPPSVVPGDPFAPNPNDYNPGYTDPYNPNYIFPNDDFLPQRQPGQFDTYRHGNTNYGQLTDNLNSQIQQSLALHEHMMAQMLGQQSYANQQIQNLSNHIMETQVRTLFQDITLGNNAYAWDWNSNHPLNDVAEGLVYLYAQEAVRNQHSPTADPEFREAMLRIFGLGIIGQLAGYKTLGTNPFTVNSPLFPDLKVGKTIDFKRLSKFARIPMWFSGTLLVAMLINRTIAENRLYAMDGAIHIPLDKADEEDNFYAPSVPVNIIEPGLTTSVKDRKKGQTVTVELNDIKVSAKPRTLFKSLGGSVRPYPRVATAGMLPMLGNAVPIMDYPDIPKTHRPIALSVAITSPTTLAITRTETRTDPITENRLKKDKKLKSMRYYLAGLAMAHASLRTVTEVMDFQKAVMANTLIRYGGLWYTMGSLPADQRRILLEQAYKGNAPYTTDWQGVLSTYLTMRAVDRFIGTRAKIERGALERLGINNTFGNPSTWLNRYQ